MADENKDLETLTDPAVTEAAETENTQAEPADEEATQLPFALGEDAPAGDTASAPTDASAESDPTSEAPAADGDLGTSDSETPAAEGLSEAPAADPTPAGDDAPVDQAPAGTGTPAAVDAPNDLGASDAAAPEADAPAEDPATSTSTGIGGDKASDVAPPEAPKVDEAPAPSPAPSSPGLFDHGTPINIPDLTVDVSEGYPIAQPGVAPAHPQHFGEMVNDGVGDDAGKVTEAPKYPTLDAPEVVDGDKGGENAGSEGGDKAAPAEQPKADDAAGEPSAVPPHVEGKLAKLFDKLAALEAKVSQLVHELLD